MDIDIALIAQFLVALGTLLLASATFWLGWSSRQERKTAKARELAISVYNPLRGNIFPWFESEPSYNDPLIELWPSLKRNQLQVIAGGVPDAIISKLDLVGPDVARVNFLKTKMITTVQEVYANLTKELYPAAQFQGQPPYMYTFVRFLVKGRMVRTIDPAVVWLRRKKVKEYVDEYGSKQYPGETWTLELTLYSVSAGKEEAQSFCNRFAQSLEADDNAKELRDLLEKVAVQGKEINSLIEVELKKG